MTSTEIGAKQLTLSHTPKTSGSVFVDAIGGGPQQKNIDFIISGAVVSWSGYGLETVLGVGDFLRITYEYEG